MATDKLVIDVLANDKASGVLRGVGGALGGLGKAAGVALSATAGLAITGLGALSASAVGMNASLETSTLQFETLLGSAEAAKDHIAGLYEFGAKTPFETGPIIAASKNLLTFGSTALDTEENLLRVGNAAAVTGGSIDDVAFWFGRAYGNIQAGKPFGEAAARLQEMGILTGDTRVKLEDMSKAGAGSTEIWQTLTAEFDRFDGAMEKQAGTWEGLVSTITDNLQLATGEALKPFFEALKDVVGVIAEFVQTDEFMSAIAQIGEQLAPLADSFGKMAIDLMTTVGPALFDGVIMPLLELVTTVGPPVMDLIGMLAEQFARLSDSLMGTLAEAFVNLTRELMPALNNLLPYVVGLVIQLADAFFGLLDLMAPLIAPLSELADDILYTLYEGLQMVLMEVFRLAEGFMPLIETILPIVADLINRLIDVMFPFVDEVLTLLVDVLLEVIDAFAPLIAEVLPVVADLFITLIEAILPLIEAILPVVVELIQVLIEVIVPLIESLMPILVELVEGLAAAIEAAIPYIEQFAGWFSDHVVPAIRDVSGAIQTAIDWVTKLASKLLDIALPDFLTPGSPTPFEIGIRGIADAMGGLVTEQLPVFNRQLSIAGSMSPAAAGMGERAIAGGMPVQLIINYSPMISLADQDEVVSRIRPLMFQIIREYNKKGGRL